MDVSSVSDGASFHADPAGVEGVNVQVAPGYTLIFENSMDETFIRFPGGWHSHGDVIAEALGVPVGEVPLVLLEGLCSGRVLLESFTYASGHVEKRLELNASKYSDLSLEPGEAVEIRRARAERVRPVSEEGS